MYITAKDRVVYQASRISKKHKALKPVMIVYVIIFSCIYRLFLHLANNGKKYTGAFFVLVFFLMSSSFSFPEKSNDNEIYLNVTGEVSNDSEVLLSDVDTAEKPVLDAVESEEWIEDSEIYKEVTSDDLISTDNIDTFTLDDFLNKQDSFETVADTKENGFDKDAWNLILVNKTHPIPDDYEVPLTTLSGSMKCDERVLEYITGMLKGAQSDKVNLIVCSPYRDYQLQTRLFNRKIDLYRSKGYSYMDAYRLTSEKVIMPGASEHQIGMAFDIVTDYHSTLDYEFGDTKAGLWLKEHCCEYGFILRYPRGKEYITGIEYEPWHFRYVGVEAATYIMENDITLEEFIDQLQ